MESLKIKDCSLVYTGGGCYIAYGQLDNGKYFYGGFESGYYLTYNEEIYNQLVEDGTHRDVDECELEYTDEKYDNRLNLAVCIFKRKHGITKEDNCSLDEAYQIACEYLKYCNSPIIEQTETSLTEKVGENKIEWWLSYMIGEDRTILWKTVYDENDELFSEEIVGWVFGNESKISYELIKSIKDCGIVCHY